MEIAEDMARSKWIVIDQREEIWRSIEEISMKEQLEVNILDLSVLAELLKQINAEENINKH